jgi:ABC-type nitrate/sulfonate/bicarbonate transport system permease component
MMASTNGVGFAALQAQRSFAIKEMWASIFILALLGYALNLAFERTERRILHWHRGMRLQARQA